jgi:YfiH family protein
LGGGKGDNPNHVARNREIVLESLGMPSHPLLLLRQVHGTQVLTVSQPWPLDEANQTLVPEADALATSTPGLALGILTADCAPVLFYDPEALVIGAAHAGWRGALKGILPATVTAMEQLGADPARILAAIGPCIHPQSYEVGEEVYATFISQSANNAAFFKPNERKHHYLLDLPGFVTYSLRQAGLKHIECLPFNTYKHPDLFFSYRRSTHQQEPATGNQISIIAL